jgi:hypothetical protein
VKFLDPTMIAVAAALTVPPLIAMYFLKLKRAVRVVPSTLLWKKAIEDLRVNAPFQRLRKSLLLLLQLLVLALTALALGKPMFQAADKHEGTLILLIDQSASMSVMEKGGATRLDQAREQAQNVVDAMSEDARAMVIAFSDRAAVVGSFDTDKQAIKRKIDSIEQSQSTTSLTEAITLAEAYSQNLIIGGEAPGSDVGAPVSAAPAASVFLFSDGRIEDAQHTPFRHIDPANMRITSIGERSDNVGILHMAARRNYERPSFLEVTAGVRNFGSAAVTVDATLYVDGRTVDVQTLQLPAADKPANEAPSPDGPQEEKASEAGTQIAVFDQIEFGGGGVVEVVLGVDDALPADDRAWSVIDPPRRLRVLLVSPDYLFLQDVLETLEVELVKMSGAQYENAGENEIAAEKRSLFDVVIFDRHSTARLPQGNYFFWAAAPQIEGVSLGEPIRNEILFDWDETHPILRYIAVDAVDVAEWFALKLPPEAKSIIDGETTPVMAHLVRNASQYFISAFSLVVRDETGAMRFNTDWPTKLDFVIFMQNAVQFLASNQSLTGKRSVVPGEPLTLMTPAGLETVAITRPDGAVDEVGVGGQQAIHYGRTRQVGVYRVAPSLPGQDAFAVNLFNAVESNIAPVGTIMVGAEGVRPQVASVEVNKPAWKYLLLALLGLLLLEWVVYNRRVMV